MDISKVLSHAILTRQAMNDISKVLKTSSEGMKEIDCYMLGVIRGKQSERKRRHSDSRQHVIDDISARFSKLSDNDKKLFIDKLNELGGEERA